MNKQVLVLKMEEWKDGRADGRVEALLVLAILLEKPSFEEKTRFLRGAEIR